MARAMKCSALRSGSTSGLGERRPRAVRHRRHVVHALAEQQAGLLEGLADRRQRQRARLGEARAAHAAHQPRAGVADRGRLATGILRSPGSMRPPGNTNLPAMNFRPAWRLPSSTFGTGAGAVDQDQRRGVARLQVRVGLVALDLGQALGDIAHACSRYLRLRPARSDCRTLEPPGRAGRCFAASS